MKASLRAATVWFWLRQRLQARLNLMDGDSTHTVNHSLTMRCHMSQQEEEEEEEEEVE